jgi:hypothetical protein
MPSLHSLCSSAHLLVTLSTTTPEKAGVVQIPSRRKYGVVNSPSRTSPYWLVISSSRTVEAFAKLGVGKVENRVVLDETWSLMNTLDWTPLVRCAKCWKKRSSHLFGQVDRKQRSRYESWGGLEIQCPVFSQGKMDLKGPINFSVFV